MYVTLDMQIMSHVNTSLLIKVTSEYQLMLKVIIFAIC